MDYTLSNSYATDAGTGNRLHLQTQAVPTAVGDADMNMVIWEAMEIVKAAGLVGAPFDKAVPATYQKLLTALRAAGVFTTPAALDNTTKAATTAFVRAELLSLGNTAYNAVFGRSLLGNGYQKLPGGLILQWVGGTTDAAGAATVTLPIAFPVSTLATLASHGNAVRDAYMTTTGAPTNTTATAYVSNTAGAAVASVGFTIFVIGY